MSVRAYGHEKVDLGTILAVIADGPGFGYGDFVRATARHFNCSERTAKDALAVLRRSGYVDVQQDECDGRRQTLFATERGVRLSSTRYAWAILRLARRLFTTCPSPRSRALPDSASQSRERLERAEATLLGPEGA